MFGVLGGGAAPKPEPVSVIVGEATPGPLVPLKETEVMVGRDTAAVVLGAAAAVAAARLVLSANADVTIPTFCDNFTCVLSFARDESRLIAGLIGR